VKMMDFEHARANMIEQQIRTWEVLDQQVLNMLYQIKREDFVPAEYKKLALSDINIPLAHDQVTMQPKVEARIIQTLKVKPADNILEIGTGCGYLTAVLAAFGNKVTSLDIFPEFSKSAQSKLEEHNIHNVEIITADGINGWQGNAPYDVIVLTGSISRLCGNFEQQLNIGGRLVAIVGDSPVMNATLVTRADDNQWTNEVIFETDIPPLIGSIKTSKFLF
jgi:protein-L-isoaspartate(D-aspartate) O-methyltransferase